MDLSFLKWPIIIGVIVFAGWLLSSSGVDYLYRHFTAGTPGADVKRDAANESGLSTLGGYCLYLFKYEKAMRIFETAVSRYPNGKNRRYNEYRMVTCAEQLGDVQKAVSLLEDLIAADAHQIDKRVPVSDNLRRRSETLIELHNLEQH
jgi:tetratricopeptide (TPR) repeat protein